MSRVFRVWLNNLEEWPAEGEPVPLGDFEGVTARAAAEAAASSGEFDGYHDTPTTMFVRDDAGNYFEVTLELAWTVSACSCMDVALIRERERKVRS